ncbi:MAG: cell division protein FtsZ [Pseudomonadota bacterium]
MTLNLRLPEHEELKPRIVVIGVGGAGGNAVNNMIEKRLEGADFVAANTDSQALQNSQAPRRIQLGVGTTQGLGAGARPEVGFDAAEESMAEIVDSLLGAHMCFITAGMGGGTGTGAAPAIARKAREMGILTVGVVTKPFGFEGSKRSRLAEEGIAQLQAHVDTLIVIPNQNLFRVANERTTFAEAFMMADDVLYQGVKGVTDLMVRPGIVNLDFADVREVMNGMGGAMMGSGEATGETRALDAAERAIANPLLDDISLKGARGVLINVTGGADLGLFEVDEAANRVRQEVDPDAAVFFGAALDPEMDGRVRVSVVATGLGAADYAVRPDLSQARGIGHSAGHSAGHGFGAGEMGPAVDAVPTYRTGDDRPMLGAAGAARPTDPAQAPAQVAAPAPFAPPASAEVDFLAQRSAAGAAPFGHALHARPTEGDDDYMIDEGSLSAGGGGADPNPAPRQHGGEYNPLGGVTRQEGSLFSGGVPESDGFRSPLSFGRAGARASEDNADHGAQLVRKIAGAAREELGTSSDRENELRVAIPAFLRRQAN